MNRSPSTCIIFNPTARGGAAAGLGSMLKGLAGADAVLRPTPGPGTARALAHSSAQEGFEVVVAAGGDGTVNDVANGLIDSGVPKVRMGLLPLGTVNVVACELGIPRDPGQAWGVVQAGVTREIDVGSIAFGKAGAGEPRRFVQMAGAGIDARAVERVSWSMKRRVGRLAYLWSLVLAMREPPPTIRVRFDRESATTAASLVILGNGRFYGGRHRLFPVADMADGRIDVAWVVGLGWGKACRILAGAVVGRLDSVTCIERRQAAGLELESQDRVRVEVDGDVAGELPCVVTVLPGVLRLLVPGRRGEVS